MNTASVSGKIDPNYSLQALSQENVGEAPPLSVASGMNNPSACFSGSVAAPTPLGVSTIPASSLSFLQPVSMPLAFGNGLQVPALQNHLLAGRLLFGPSAFVSNQLTQGGSNLNMLVSGVQALQNSTPSLSMLPSASLSVQQRILADHNNAKEIRDSLDVSLAAPAQLTKKDVTRPTEVQKLPCVVFIDWDEESLSDYQCLLRKQIELFEATTSDVQWNAQGRNKAIVLGQVGIRCRHCARLPTWSRSRGAVYYSATLDGLYQAAQNMAKNHLCKHCRLIPQDIRDSLSSLRDCKRRASGGKKYWAEGAKVFGIYQCEDGLRFKNSKIAPRR